MGTFHVSTPTAVLILASMMFFGAIVEGVAAWRKASRDA